MPIHVELKRAGALSADERAAWMAIQTGTPRLGSPYFALGFFDAVAAVRGDVRVIVQSGDGTPDAFLPLQLGAMGYARPLSGPLADHHGVIAADGTPVDAATLLRAAGISVYDFFGWMPHPGTALGEVSDGSWVVDLSGGMEAFKARRKKAGGNTFRTIFSANRKLAEAGHDLEFCPDDTSEEALAQLFEWKSGQYRASGHFDVFSVDWTRKLIVQLCALDGSSGVRGRVSSLRIDGKLAAVHFGMMTPRAMHYWFPAYDPNLSKASPGNALLDLLLESLCEEGVDEVHLGPGDYRYKAALGSWQMPLAQGYVATEGPAALLRRAAAGLEASAEALPLGPVSELPGKAFRRLDRMTAFRAA